MPTAYYLCAISTLCLTHYRRSAPSELPPPSVPSLLSALPPPPSVFSLPLPSAPSWILAALSGSSLLPSPIFSPLSSALPPVLPPPVLLPSVSRVSLATSHCHSLHPFHHHSASSAILCSCCVLVVALATLSGSLPLLPALSFPSSVLSLLPLPLPPPLFSPHARCLSPSTPSTPLPRHITASDPNASSLHRLYPSAPPTHLDPLHPRALHRLDPPLGPARCPAISTISVPSPASPSCRHLGFSYPAQALPLLRCKDPSGAGPEIACFRYFRSRSGLAWHSCHIGHIVSTSHGVQSGHLPSSSLDIFSFSLARPRLSLPWIAVDTNPLRRMLPRPRMQAACPR
ncbi:hypothetical protein EDB86DRAFT_2963775 [Lactarius hatsudake]|nr:hypothetical protein EDB86DRAFT_2963775 [Lactarius hatsudake]